jgi:hypothetical protein
MAEAVCVANRVFLFERTKQFVEPSILLLRSELAITGDYTHLKTGINR